MYTFILYVWPLANCPNFVPVPIKRSVLRKKWSLRPWPAGEQIKGLAEPSGYTGVPVPHGLTVLELMVLLRGANLAHLFRAKEMQTLDWAD